VILERFSPEAVLAAIARHRVTFFPGVATMFRRLLASPALARADLSSVRLALSGAAPCPWDLAQEWRQRTGVRILRGYGLTELFRPISYLADDPRDFPDAIGRVVPGVDARVIDDDARTLPAGDVGELLLRTPAVMDGYLNAPEDTDAVLVDGWFKTGDLATLTAEGFVRIAGRKKDLILRGGYSVYPQEVETVLLTHPDIAEAAVVGIQHEELGEEVAAFVTLHPGATASIDHLTAWCRSRLAAYKCPRRFTVVAELPRSATGKILKSRLV
jgi:long-chain acyl-CoA synthetase